MKNLNKYKNNILLFILLLVAAFFRLYKIQDYMTFLGDEGRDSLVVYNILHGHFTLLGPTASVGGFFLGPIYYYFMAPFLLIFNYNPIGPAIMIALLGVATVWLIYKVANELFGKITAVVSASLYAISPIVLAYSRSSWNPNPMPFFTLLLFYLLYKAVLSQNMRLYFICGVLLGIMMQLHYLTVFVVVITAVFVLFVQILPIVKNKKSHIIQIIVKNYAYILGGFLVGWLPFLLFELKHGFLNIKSIINFIFHSGNTGGNTHYFTIIISVYERLFTRLLTNFPEVQSAPVQAELTTVFWFYLSLLIGIMSTLLLFIQCMRLYNKKPKEFIAKSLFVLWLFIGVLLFGFYKKPIYDYYFEFLFPVPFLLVGNLAQEFYAFKIFGKVLVIGIIGWLILVNVQKAPFLFQGNRQLAQAEEIARFVDQKTNGKPFNFALITGANSDHAYRYFFTVWHHEPVTIQNAQVDQKRTTVTDQLLVICESLPCYPLGDSLWEIAGFGRADIAGVWDVSVVKVYKLIHYKGPS